MTLPSSPPPVKSAATGAPKAPDGPSPDKAGGWKALLANKKRWFLPLQSLRQLLAQEDSAEDVVADEADAVARHRRLIALISAQALAIGILSGIMILGAPVMRPVYKYKTVAQDNANSLEQFSADLVPLFNPNLTNRAVLSWAATSVTEVMTLGFGDFDRQLIAQRKRFTAQGWESFLKALIEQKIRNAFKEQQLILTTVPSDVPVIVAQGEDPEDGYKWVVELPVIMTFATNNNVTKKSRTIVRLTIVRVPGQDSVGGIAIKSWEVA